MQIYARIIVVLVVAFSGSSFVSSVHNGQASLVYPKILIILMIVARYNMNQDGFYRLQTVCYEDVKVETVDEDEAAVDSPEASMCPSSPASVVT